MTNAEGTVVTDQRRARGSGQVRTAVVWGVLRTALDRIAGESGRDRLDVIDAGGGTGGFAVPLARLGHRVTVVDSSPDALAALARRAADEGVSVRGFQGDADALPGALGDESADLVLCHSVLEYVDDPLAAMTSLAAVVRPGGSLSVVAGGRLAAVLHRAIAGQVEEARRALADAAGCWGDRDPVPRRFTSGELADLAARAGLEPGDVQGVRVLADLVPGSVVDGDQAAVDALIALETAAATHPVLRDIATQLHLLARKPR